MGHSAKYGSYTMFCSSIMKIVHFELLQVSFDFNCWVFWATPIQSKCCNLVVIFCNYIQSTLGSYKGMSGIIKVGGITENFWHGQCFSKIVITPPQTLFWLFLKKSWTSSCHLAPKIPLWPHHLIDIKLKVIKRSNKLFKAWHYIMFFAEYYNFKWTLIYIRRA